MLSSTYILVEKRYNRLYYYQLIVHVHGPDTYLEVFDAQFVKDDNSKFLFSDDEYNTTICKQHIRLGNRICYIVRHFYITELWHVRLKCKLFSIFG